MSCNVVEPAFLLGSWKNKKTMMMMKYALLLTYAHIYILYIFMYTYINIYNRVVPRKGRRSWRDSFSFTISVKFVVTAQDFFLSTVIAVVGIVVVGQQCIKLQYNCWCQQWLMSFIHKQNMHQYIHINIYRHTFTRGHIRICTCINMYIYIYDYNYGCHLAKC